MITHFFSGHSQYAYLGFAKLLSVADRHGLNIDHRPMDLHAVMAAAGVSPFDSRPKAALKYFFVVEARRWAKYRKVEWNGRIPDTHGYSYERANLFLVSAGIHEQDLNVLAFNLLRAHWVEGADLTDETLFSRLLGELNVASDAAHSILGALDSDAVTSQYAHNTAAAIERGVMGSPTYVVGDDMLYGQDRLEMLDWLLEDQHA